MSGPQLQIPMHSAALPREPAFFTLSEPEFQDACRRLADISRSVEPDVIVGLATGGVYVAEAMQDHLPAPVELVTLRLRRPGTAVKEYLRSDVVLSRLPRRLSYLLRWLEVAMRERMLKRSPSADLTPTEVPDPDDRVTLERAARVLVVDDTIDSGRTLQAATSTIRSHNEHCIIRTAVLASTWRKPPVAPDFLIYPRTLVRFHWSLDVR